MTQRRIASSSRSGVSIIRVALIVGVVGILIIGAGVASFFIDQASRQVPFDVTVYPNALYWGENNVETNSREIYYRTVDLPEEVAEFYQAEMNRHYGDAQQRCIRLPPEGVSLEAERDNNLALYQFVCLFDRSGFRTTQYTRVVIYPGRANADPFLNANGLTIVKYEQQWQR